MGIPRLYTTTYFHSLSNKTSESWNLLGFVAVGKLDWPEKWTVNYSQDIYGKRRYSIIQIKPLLRDIFISTQSHTRIPKGLETHLSYASLIVSRLILHLQDNSKVNFWP